MGKMPKMNVVVMGLGHFGGGIGAAKWYASQGHHVIVTDQQPEEKLTGSIARLSGLTIEYSLGGHDDRLLDNCDLLVVSPAVHKKRSAFFQAALARSIPYTTEINEFCLRCPAPIIGVTGSAGKSTTASMMHTVFTAMVGEDRCCLGGNIGQSLLGQLPLIRADHFVVLELSSFMLEDMPLIEFSPHVAVVTNLVNNHLDRHGTMADYAAAKINILRFQTPTDFAVLNRNDPHVCAWGAHTKGRVLYFEQAKINLQSPGPHNQANAAAALTVVQALGFADRMPIAVRALENFQSLPHRMELVGRSNNHFGQNVDWINDSKATTPESTLTALQAVPPGRALVIVGGADKHADISLLAEKLVEFSWGIITMGTTGTTIADAIKRCINKKTAEFRGGSPPRLAEVKTLEEAVMQAQLWLAAVPSDGVHAEISAPGCVLLSPACASYDQFLNYEHRGAVFKELVAKLMSSGTSV